MRLPKGSPFPVLVEEKLAITFSRSQRVSRSEIFFLRIERSI